MLVHMCRGVDVVRMHRGVDVLVHMYRGVDVLVHMCRGVDVLVHMCRGVDAWCPSQYNCTHT